MCVCVHCILGEVLLSFTLHCCGEVKQNLSNAEKMLRAQVISQQNTQTENQNVVTLCHSKKYFKNSIKIKNIKNIENILYFRTKISAIYPIYINDIYQRYISSQTCYHRCFVQKFSGTKSKTWPWKISPWPWTQVLDNKTALITIIHLMAQNSAI